MAEDSSIIVIRCGGCHAAVVWETAQQTIFQDAGENVVLWDNSGNCHSTLAHLRFVSSANELLRIVEDANFTTVKAIVCIGSPHIREVLVNELTGIFSGKRVLEFPNIIHPSAVVSSTVVMGVGNYIGPLTVVNTSASIGSFCVVNTHAVVEHDCRLEDYATINPGAVLCGTVTIGRSSVIGAQATVREKCNVTDKVIVGMQAAVVRGLSIPSTTWLGVPARPKLTNPDCPSPLSPPDLIAESVHGEFKKINKITNTNMKQMNINWCVKKHLSMSMMHSYLAPSLISGHVTNQGPLMKILSHMLKSVSGSTKEPLPAASGTAALHALAAGWAIKMKRRLRFATQCFTFPCAVQGPLYDSVIVDMDETLWGPSLDAMDLVKDEIDGIIVTNIFGLQAELDVYEHWCKKHNKLLLLDNAATPVGVYKDGRNIVDVGDGSIISLHETKAIGRGEGGALFVNAEMVPYMMEAMNFGFDERRCVRDCTTHCSNWRMSDIAGAAICCHLHRVLSDNWVDKQGILIDFAMRALERRGLKIEPTLRMPTILGCLFVRVPDSAVGKIDDLCRLMNAHVPKYEAKHYYLPLGSREEFPVAWMLYDRNICLPFHLDLTVTDIERMLDVLMKAVDEISLSVSCPIQKG